MNELKPCPSPVENAITVLKNEKQCVLRQIQIGGCDRNCVKCDLVMKDSKILAGYDTAIAVLRLARPDHDGEATAMPANEPLITCGECAKYQTPDCAAKHEQALMDFCSHGIRKPGGEQE